jgi:hypothetical protein
VLLKRAPLAAGMVWFVFLVAARPDGPVPGRQGG